MSEATLAAKIKAYDEYSALFHQFEKDLRRLNSTQEETSKTASRSTNAMSLFLQTLGQVGLLYAFQRGLMAIVSTGREFEATIKQAQAVTGDFTSTLRNLAMTQGDAKLDVHTPRELALAYRELGAAGASTNDIISMTPDILEFSNAAMIEAEQSAYGVLSAIKAFNMEMTQTQEVTDAYTEAMNRGALAGEDFQWIMSSAGAVAKMAGQDFREIISAAAAMRDAGVQAQDAGTSIKSSLMYLINPTAEAQRAMEDLGIEIYNASGQMKQWHEIVAEFEQALAPYNEQSRQMILTTIFGTDGIRAMATSLNKGSLYLETFTQGITQADGATREMAEAMSDTFDGAMRRVNTQLERAKILLFEDFEQGAVGLLDIVDKLLISFNEMDDSTRQMIEALVGGAGLAVAFMAVNSSIRAVIASEKALAALRFLTAGPWGLLALAVGVAGTALISYSQQTAEAKERQEELNKELKDTQRLQTKGITADEVSVAQERVKALDEEIQKLKERRAELEATEQYWRDHFMENPNANTWIDEARAEREQVDTELQSKTQLQQAYNDALDRQIALDSRAAMELANKAAQTQIETQATTQLIDKYLELSKQSGLTADQQDELDQVTQQLAQKFPFLISAIDDHGRATKLNADQLENQKNVLNALSLAETENARVTMQANLDKTMVVLEQTKTRINILLKEQETLVGIARLIGDEETARQMQTYIGGQIKQLQTDVDVMQQTIEIYKAGLDSLGKIKIDTTGTKTWEQPEKETQKTRAAADAAKKAVDKAAAALYAYQAAVDAVNYAVQRLSAKEQYLIQVMMSSEATSRTATELNRVRLDQLDNLARQQGRLADLADQERAQLNHLYELSRKTHDPEQLKVYRDEIAKLTGQIAQLSNEWWQAEIQELTIRENMRQAVQKQYDDAYSKAMSLMRHEVAMSRMSTEQQIDYLERLRIAHQWTQDQMWALEEELYQLRRRQLSDMLDELTSEYESALDDLDARTKKQLDSIQQQLDAMDDEEQQADREETTKQHNDRMKKLQDDLAYWSVRTGSEAQQQMQDIQEQIANEEREWANTQAQWARDDQRANLEAEREQIEENAEEERRILDEHYREAREIAEEGILEIIATLAATSPEWYKTGEDLINQLISGLESGDFSSVIAKIDEARTGSSYTGGAGGNVTVPLPGTDSALAVIGPGQYSRIGDTTIMWSKELANLLGESVKWDPATGRVNIAGHWFSPVKIEDDRAYVGIRTVAEELGYRVEWDPGTQNVNIYRAGEGALFTGPTLTWMAEAREAEAAMPLSKLQPMMNDAAAAAWERTGFADAIERAADRIVGAMHERLGINIDKLLNIDTYEASDETDVDILTGSLRDAVISLQATR